MSSPFSAVLLAGGHSTRMGEDKAFIEINGTPVWQRQLQILRSLSPRELFIAGPAHAEWRSRDCIIIADVQSDAGPLAGLVAALRSCSAPLLLAVAIDLPNMTAEYLRGLAASCSSTKGIVPRRDEHFEPVAAMYPTAALHLAECGLASRSYSLQAFAARCVAAGLADVKPIAPEDEPLFFNMNTPADLLTVTNG